MRRREGLVRIWCMRSSLTGALVNLLFFGISSDVFEKYGGNSFALNYWFWLYIGLINMNAVMCRFLVANVLCVLVEL